MVFEKLNSYKYVNSVNTNNYLILTPMRLRCMLGIFKFVYNGNTVEGAYLNYPFFSMGGIIKSGISLVEGDINNLDPSTEQYFKPKENSIYWKFSKENDYLQFRDLDGNVSNWELCA